MVSRVLGTIHTNNKSDEVCTHHHQNVEDSTNNIEVAKPPLFPISAQNGTRTIDGETAFLAITSRRMKSPTSQLHAKSRAEVMPEGDKREKQQHTCRDEPMRPIERNVPITERTQTKSKER